MKVRGKLDKLYYYKSNKKELLFKTPSSLSDCRGQHIEHGLYGFPVYQERLNAKGTLEQLLARDLSPLDNIQVAKSKKKKKMLVQQLPPRCGKRVKGRPLFSTGSLKLTVDDDGYIFLVP